MTMFADISSFAHVSLFAEPWALPTPLGSFVYRSVSNLSESMPLSFIDVKVLQKGLLIYEKNSERGRANTLMTLHNLQQPVSVFKVCCKVPIKQGRCFQRVLAAAVIAVVPRQDAFSPLQLSLFPLSFSLSSAVSLTHVRTSLFFPLPLSCFG